MSHQSSTLNTLDVYDKRMRVHGETIFHKHNTVEDLDDATAVGNNRKTAAKIQMHE